MLRPTMQANSRNRSALLGGARAPVVGAAGPSGSIYDDETAKAIESHSNKLQEELHSKVLALKSVC